MKFRKIFIVLFCITLVGAFLRFYKLGEVPASMNADEVAIGYNAYSILKTGMDEYGKTSPMLFQSFDDFKLPIYVYLTVPSIAVFGLTDFAVRFPSALFGTLTVLLTYFLVKELFLQSKNQEPASTAKRGELGTRNLPLLSALLLAISPWHLQFSRSAYEANLAVFFTVLGVTLLLMALRNKWFYLVGFIALSLSVWSYHSSRIFIPLMVLSFTILYFRDIWRNKLFYVTGALFCFIICIPLLLLSFSSSGLVRAKGVSALNDPVLVKRNVSWRQTDIELGIPYSNIYHNHRLVNIPIILKGYFDHYNPNFFFSEVVQGKYHAPGVGLMYLWELPFLLIGIFALLRPKTYDRSSRLLICWFLFAPIAASVTHMLPHPVRTLVFLPTLQIFTAFGVITMFLWIKTPLRPRSEASREQIANNKSLRTKTQDLRPKIFVYCLLFTVLILSSTVYYLHQYYVHGPVDFALDWQYGHEQVVKKVKAIENNFDTVVVSTTLDQPYIFFLYYLRYDPQMYLSSGGTRSGKFDEEKNAFGKYEFHSYMKVDIIADPHTLYVGTPGEMIPGTCPLSDVRDPSGNIIYVLWGTMTKEQWNQAGNLPRLD